MSEKETDGVGKLREAFDGCEGTRPAVGASLGERAIACKHWKWLPGMLLDGGARVVDCLGGGDARGLIRCWDAGEGDSDRGYPAEFGLPDLTDPATLGCLLALVREAWGDASISVCKDACGAWVCDAMRGQKLLAEADAEAEALVCALEAAP